MTSKRKPKPSLDLHPAAELAMNPVVAALKKAREHPLEPGKTNFIWDQHPIPEVREAARPIDPDAAAAMSPNERGQAEWDRVQRIKAAYAAFAQRSGLGTMLFERTRAALDRCFNEDELRDALIAILEDDVRNVATRVLRATNKARASNAGSEGAINKKDEAAERRKRIKRLVAQVEQEHGGSVKNAFVAATLAERFDCGGYHALLKIVGELRSRRKT